MGAITKADRHCQLSARAGAQIRPLIARVLADEHWFGNKPPGWPGAPSFRDAKNTRKRYIKRLRRFTPQLPKAAHLAGLLARCKRRRRCMSGACPECGRAFQRWFVSQVMNLASYENSRQLIAVSIAFPHHRSVGDKLDTLNTTKMKRDVTETIKDSDLIHWMAGGIDLSLNDDTQRNVPICWQGQLYGFTEVSNRRQFSKLLRDTFKKTRKVKRPSKPRNATAHPEQSPTDTKPISSGVSVTAGKLVHLETAEHAGKPGKCHCDRWSMSGRCCGSTGSDLRVDCSSEACV